MWTIVHDGVRRRSGGRSKYCVALGYTWADLRAYLEERFTPGMSWENWGEVWELDHIKPLSSFQYQSLEDPLFRECWALSNLRPLHREANATKGAKTGYF
jgi:predicted AlkP superfamily pyrophosphatase or phosphodiesterase